jgi:hypothetical protein
MGLDTSWYRGLKKRDDVIFDGDGEPTNVENYYRPYANDDFAGREKPLEHRAVYEYEASGREGIHMGYGSYNHWRDWLAKIAGWPEKTYRQYDRDWPSHCVDCWNGATGPFSELINFSDCEGAIGAEVAAKLAKDFAEYDEKAKAGARDERDYQIYRDMRFAFEQAAQNGAVDFH